MHRTGLVLRLLATLLCRYWTRLDSQCLPMGHKFLQAGAVTIKDELSMPSLISETDSQAEPVRLLRQTWERLEHQIKTGFPQCLRKTPFQNGV